MRYQLKQIHCRPWTLSYLSVPLIESHCESNYGGAMRRLNAKYMNSGHSGWKAAGGALKLQP